jgi:anti-sigma regulatory factor (Ser/Thr protein kinase)
MDRRTEVGDPTGTTRPGPHRPYTEDDLSAVRHEVVAHARAAGFSAERCTDVAIVVSELITNSVVHGGGAGSIRSWTHGDAVVHEVSDAGTVVDGDVPAALPPADHPGGRGLWLVDHLSDRVQRRSTPTGTTTTVTLGPRPPA